jgi:hypothetical protein
MVTNKKFHYVGYFQEHYSNMNQEHATSIHQIQLKFAADDLEME